MKYLELICPCHFGLEAVLKREITDLGYNITEVTDGKVVFEGTPDELCEEKTEYTKQFVNATIDGPMKMN